jgi:hypothetical protein
MQRGLIWPDTQRAYAGSAAAQVSGGRAKVSDVIEEICSWFFRCCALFFYTIRPDSVNLTNVNFTTNVGLQWPRGRLGP